MNYKISYKSIVFVFFLVGFLLVFSPTLATKVDRISLTNLEGYPGETIKQEITLEGTDPEERSGFWYTYYKKMEGDNDQMDITSWITIEPKDFTIKQGEVKTFTIQVKIPKNAKPGLWGAISEEAGKEGHSDERRTYIVFKDGYAGGNVYSGLLIPISVNVLSNKNPLTVVFNFVIQNILIIVFTGVIIVMAILLLIERKKKVVR